MELAFPLPREEAVSSLNLEEPVYLALASEVSWLLVKLVSLQEEERLLEEQLLHLWLLVGKYVEIKNKQ